MPTRPLKHKDEVQTGPVWAVITALTSELKKKKKRIQTQKQPIGEMKVPFNTLR